MSVPRWTHLEQAAEGGSMSTRPVNLWASLLFVALVWALELPPIGWQLFILGSSQSDSTAFPSFLDTYATRLLAEPLNERGYL